MAANLYEVEARAHKAIMIARAVPADITADQLRLAADQLEGGSFIAVRFAAELAHKAGVKCPSPETLREVARRLPEVREHQDRSVQPVPRLAPAAAGRVLSPLGKARPARPLNQDQPIDAVTLRVSPSPAATPGDTAAGMNGAGCRSREKANVTVEGRSALDGFGAAPGAPLPTREGAK